MDLTPHLRGDDSPQLPESEEFRHFRETLSHSGLALVRDVTITLQINVGLVCNQACRHCHLEAGPHRREIMGLQTVEDVIAYARRGRFSVVDITGGAPELNPHLTRLITGLAPSRPKDHGPVQSDRPDRWAPDGPDGIFQGAPGGSGGLLSFPAGGPDRYPAGSGVFQASINALRQLNALGYGRADSGLELDLVSNPSGAFLPPSQAEAEKRFRKELENRWDLVFNHLYVFANVPLGRYRDWLDRSGNLQRYQEKLAAGFNPCALIGVMCRSLISVSWEGYLYDCDFNLALNLPFEGRKTHITEMEGPPPAGTPIRVGDHCYACTAGSGFT